jgi:hypothetical protein
VTQALPVTQVATTPTTATLTVRMQGVTAGTHVVGVKLNGTYLGTVTVQDQQSNAASFAVATASLASGASVTLTAQGSGPDMTVVETVALTYPRTYVAEANGLRCTAASGRPVTISGFTSNQVRVMDITDPAHVTAPKATVTLKNGAYALAFVPQNGGTRTLLAFTAGQAPASVVANQPSSWHTAQAGADLVIVSHKDFLGSLTPLVQLRQSQRLTVAVADVEDLYDEFNDGMPSPYAVQNFLLTAQAAWTTKPRWVLLVGDATNDPRDYRGLHEVNFVPTALVPTTYMEIGSDDWFGDVDGDGISEVATGRLPVQTAADATRLVTKIVAYDAAVGAAWKTKALLVAGTNDAENDFEGYTDAVSALLPAEMTVTKVLEESTPTPAAAFLAAFNAGQGLVNFVGHGSVELWNGDLFTSDAAGAVTNGAATPFLLALTCLNGNFENAGTYSLAEAVLQAPGGGAVGVWASSGLTESAPQATLNQAMISALYGGAPITVGEAARLAKLAVADRDVRTTWILFGDPSMRIR